MRGARDGFFAHLALFCAYLILTRLSQLFRTTDYFASPWHPEVGLATIAGAVLGAPAIVTVSLAHVVGGWLSATPQFHTVLIGTALSTGFVFVGTSFRLGRHYWTSGKPASSSVYRLLIFASATTLISGIIRLVLSAWSLQVSVLYYWPYALTNAVGNLIGIISILPMFQHFQSSQQLADYVAKATRQRAVALIGIAVTSIIVFGLPWTNEFKFFYLLFPPVLALALVDGMKGAAVSAMMVDTLMVAILFLRQYEPWPMAELQMFMLTLNVSGLILGAAIDEKLAYAERLVASSASLQESQATLMQASRLTMANAVAAALAHELNQPLSSVKSFLRAATLRLARQRLNKQAMQAMLQGAISEIDRAAHMIQSTRSFLSRGNAAFQKLDVQEIIQSSIALSKPLRGQRAPVMIFQPSGRPLAIFGYRTELQQVLMSLIRNSQEALSSCGQKDPRIVIEVDATSRPGFAEISIADNGPGISAEARKRLFMPLQSSKSEGLGIGLSIAKAIVTAHGGDIWLDENHSKGARFSLTLPLSEQRHDHP